MTAKPTAFARVPRGKQTSDSTKASKPIRMDATFLERLERANMSPDLSTVMTKTDSDLSIRINAQAGVGYSLVNKTGRTIADKADIKRIQTMSASITKERKAALNEELGLATKYLLVAFLQKSKESSDIGEITKFHKGFVQILRTVNLQFQTLTKNIQVIESIAVTSGDGSETVKNILIEMGRRISSAVGKFLFHRAKLAEEETPKKINEFLFEKHVPIAIFKRLTERLINVSVQGFEINHILFPKDPSKGITVTFKEVRNKEFRQDMMGLLEGSKLMVRMALEDDLIRSMINVKSSTPLDDFEVVNSLASKLANTPFYVIPFPGITNVSDYFGFLAKNGVRGTTWVSGTVLTPVDLLKYYGTIAKRMFSVLVTRPQTKATLLEKIFPGFIFDVENETTDIFVQLKTWAVNPKTSIAWFKAIRNFGTNAKIILVLRELFNDVASVSQDHAISEAFATMLRKADTPYFKGSTISSALLFSEVKNLAVSLRQTGQSPEDQLGDKIDSLSGGKKKKDRAEMEAGVMERSRLSDVSREAVQELKTRGYIALSGRMRSWFRLFLDETVQEAVAALFLARLESFLEAPLEVTREERQGFMDPDDPDDDEPSEDEADPDKKGGKKVPKVNPDEE